MPRIQFEVYEWYLSVKLVTTNFGYKYVATPTKYMATPTKYVATPTKYIATPTK